MYFSTVKNGLHCNAMIETDTCSGNNTVSMRKMQKKSDKLKDDWRNNTQNIQKTISMEIISHN